MATKKAKRSKVSHRPKVRIVRDAPVGEVFSATPPEAERIAVPRGSVQLFVNGRSHGNVQHGNITLGEFARRTAQGAGIRTFSVYGDGVKLDTSNAKDKMSKFAKLEIVAKDSRGGDSPAVLPSGFVFSGKLKERVTQLAYTLTPAQREELFGIIHDVAMDVANSAVAQLKEGS